MLLERDVTPHMAISQKVSFFLLVCFGFSQRWMLNIVYPGAYSYISY